AIWNSYRLAVAGVNPDDYSSAFEFVEGQSDKAFSALGGNAAVLVPLKLSTDMGIRLGDQMSLQNGQKQVTFTVAGIIAHSFPSADNYGALVVSRDIQRELTASDAFNFIV